MLRKYVLPPDDMAESNQIFILSMDVWNIHAQYENQIWVAFSSIPDNSCFALKHLCKKALLNTTCTQVLC